MKKRSKTSGESFDVTDGMVSYETLEKCRWGNDMRFPVYPVSFTDVSRSDGRYLRHVNYPNIALELVLDGEILYTDAETQYIVSRGSMFLIVPHSNVKMVNANPGKNRRKLVIIAAGSAPGLICDMLGFNGDKLLKLENPSAVEKRMRRIGRLISSNGDRKLAACLFYELLLTLSIEYRKSFQPLPPPMQTLKNFICANLKRELSSEQLAGVIGVSPATLRRQVRRCFSCSPLELCTSLRLEHAAMLLRTTGRAVKDIALDCGFNSPLYFGTVFKSVYGMTPGRYRNSGPTDDPPFRFVQE